MITLYTNPDKGLRVMRLPFVVLLILAFVLSGCNRNNGQVDATAILSRVDIGVSRKTAIQTLSDAWYHTECPYIDGRMEDLFLYGPKDTENVTIISIESRPEGEGYVVTQIGTYEPYFLDPVDAFKECKPPVLDAFDN